MTVDLDALDRLDAAANECPSADMVAQYIIDLRNAYPALAAEIRELRAGVSLSQARAENIDALEAENEALRARVSEIEHRYAWTLHCMGRVDGWAREWDHERHGPMLDWLAGRIAVEARNSRDSENWPPPDYVARAAPPATGSQP